MTVATDQQRIALVVTNPQRLRLGTLPRHNFDRRGGVLGSGSADWLLADGRGSVQPRHCQIVWEDGAFCVVDRCGATRINDSPDALGQDVSVRLAEGDRLYLGPVCIIVHLEEGDHSLPDPSRHLAEHSVDELLNAQDHSFESLPPLPPESAESAGVDPTPPEFRALTRPLDDIPLDPLQAMDNADIQHDVRTSSESLDPHHYGMSEPTTPPDLAQTRFEALSGSPRLHFGDNRMSSQELNAGARPAPADLNYYGQLEGQVVGGDPRAAIAPLLEGLGAPLGELDAQSSYRLLYEAGQTLGALIHGLLALYQQQVSGETGIGLQGRTLQPIEDNPLRLGLDYETTLQAMFSGQRSLVHLSPKAAVDESLAQLRRHNEALVSGIAAGLDALLQAFDPALLMERFSRYQPGQAGSTSQGEWAWHMYAHYYSELKSNRQGGFSKLFREVFDQHYDRALRTEA
ncbi:type VI secretion system-associated FHA domain protein TagH [Pseudomonas aeruginosa]|nr:type VI secretion system-associated FHA domain protein TagH [Pseudomonas aeruginosa]